MSFPWDDNIWRFRPGVLRIIFARIRDSFTTQQSGRHTRNRDSGGAGDNNRTSFVPETGQILRHRLRTNERRCVENVADLACISNERFEVLETPTISDRPGSPTKFGLRRERRRPRSLAYDVRQEAEESGALDGAREFALLLGGDGGDAARPDLAALGDVTHQQL